MLPRVVAKPKPPVTAQYCLDGENQGDIKGNMGKAVETRHGLTPHRGYHNPALIGNNLVGSRYGKDV